jgi:hypothetical protein
MAINRASFNGNNYGSPESELQFGPYNLGSCTKLLRVTASLTNSNVAGTYDVGQALTGPFIWGVQWVPHGNSPLSLPADAFEANFLWVRNIHTDGYGTLTWAPSSDTAGSGTVDIATYEWRGQLPIGQDIDLYVTMADLVTGAPSLQGSFSMVVINTT